MINVTKKEKNSKLPSKKTMNLYQIEITDNSWQRVIPYAVLIIIIAVAFTKFGVFQRISNLNKLGDRVAEAQIMLDEINETIEDYDEIQAKYTRYTGNFMLEEEGTLVDRTRIISLIGENVSNLGDIKSYSITGNTVSLEFTVDALDDVRRIRKQLEDVDWVGNITVNTATKNISSNGTGRVLASIVFDAIYQGDFETAAPEAVSSEDTEAENNSTDDIPESNGEGAND